MAIDSALSPFDEDLEGEGGLEISIENPDSVAIATEDGGVLIDFDPNNPLTVGMNHSSNLAEFVDPAELYRLGSSLVGSYLSDKDSRKDWEDSYIR